MEKSFLLLFFKKGELASSPCVDSGAAAGGRRFVVSVSTSLDSVMRTILLWAIGVPIPVLILLYLLHVI